MARDLNGSTDIVTVTDFALGTGGLTVMAWVQADSLISADRMVLNQADFVGSFTNVAFDLYHHVTGGFRFRISTDGTTVQGTSGRTAASPTVWYHVAGTYDNETVNDYVNGIVGAPNTTPTGSLFNSTLDIKIGSFGASNQGRWDGRIADARLYGVALTADEIIWAMLGGLPRPQQCLMWLPLWGVSSPEPDWSGNGHTAALTGTLRGDHPPLISADWMGGLVRRVISGVGGVAAYSQAAYRFRADDGSLVSP